MIAIPQAVITKIELLTYREVHPTWVVNSRLSSQAFKPTKKDAGKLSIRNSEKITAEASYKFQTEKLNFKSVGNWAISVGEIIENALQCIESPKVDEPQDPSHCHMDFATLTGGQIQTKADKLVVAARNRGPTYQPPSQNQA